MLKTRIINPNTAFSMKENAVHKTTAPKRIRVSFLNRSFFKNSGI